MQQTQIIKNLTVQDFLRDLAGKNRSLATIRAYHTDLPQFFRFLEETNLTATSPEGVTKADISEYLSMLSQRGVSGVSRARVCVQPPCGAASSDGEETGEREPNDRFPS